MPRFNLAQLSSGDRSEPIFASQFCVREQPRLWRDCAQLSTFFLTLFLLFPQTFPLQQFLRFSRLPFFVNSHFNTNIMDIKEQKLSEINIEYLNSWFGLLFTNQRET